MIKTAILFKTHFWSREVELNFESILINSRKSDIYIILDNDKLEIIPEKIRNSYNILQYTKEKASEIGLMVSEENEGGFWYNGDYHQNIFISYHNQYDYICSVENDVYVDTNIDKIFSRMFNEEIDVVCKIQRIPNSNWSHLENCFGYYDTDKYINKALFCISFFSKRSSSLILKKRLEMTSYKKKEGISSWPIGECVMIQEPIMANHRVLDLEKFCSSLSMYDWAPSYLHIQTKKFSNTVYHPVSNLEKYLYTNFHQPYNCFATGDEMHVSKALIDISYINNYFVYAEAYCTTSSSECKSIIIQHMNNYFNIFDENWVDVSYDTNFPDLHNITYNDYTKNIPIYENFVKIEPENNKIDIDVDIDENPGNVLSIMTSSNILIENQEYESKKISDDLFLTKIMCLKNNISFSLAGGGKVFGLFFEPRKNKSNLSVVKFEDTKKISNFSNDNSVNAYVVSYDSKEKCVIVVINSIYRHKLYCYNFDINLCNKDIKINVNSGFVSLL